jgi:plasmid stability protein
MMASLVVRNIDETVKTRLRIRAAEHGHSMEEEVRGILKEAVERDPPRNLADLALEIFGPRHGIDLGPLPRLQLREPPRFDSVDFDLE